MVVGGCVLCCCMGETRCFCGFLFVGAVDCPADCNGLAIEGGFEFDCAASCPFIASASVSATCNRALIVERLMEGSREESDLRNCSNNSIDFSLRLRAFEISPRSLRESARSRASRPRETSASVGIFFRFCMSRLIRSASRIS